MNSSPQGMNIEDFGNIDQMSFSKKMEIVQKKYGSKSQTNRGINQFVKPTFFMSNK